MGFGSGVISDTTFLYQHARSTQSNGTDYFVNVPAQATQSAANTRVILAAAQVFAPRIEPRVKQGQRTKVAVMSKVLVIADDVESSGDVAEILEYAGHTVKTLRTSGELFRVFSQFVPDVVVMNMNIPGISSILTLSFIRRLTEVAHTKVIVLTANTQVASSAKSMWRAEVVLVKPVSPEQVLAAVTRYL